jgi:predicted metalloendopeptidase
MSEQTSEDRAVRPQDDLFGHVNGAWLASAEIPADLPIAGAFVDLILAAEHDAAEILRDAAARSAAGEAEPGSNQQKLGDIFASFMDEERAEELGAEPLRHDLAAIDAAKDLSALLRLLGRFERFGVTGVVGVHVDTDDKDSDRSVVKLSQGGIGLPDESYYREDTFAEIRTKYVTHVAAMLELVGHTPDEAADAADRIMALETRLASGHWDRVANRDVQKTYNLMTRAELAEAAPMVDWDAWIAGMEAPDIAFDRVVVRQPSYLDTLDEAVREVGLEDWKAWLRWQVVHEAAPYLSETFVRENFAFYTKTLSGSEEMRERWKRGVTFAEGALGEALGQEYVARHFPPASKAAMDALVANLVEAYRRDIEKLEWMGPQTRERALEKLTTFRPKIGYPERWRDYSALTIDRADLIGNARRASAFETDRQLAKIGRPVDRDEWLITPQTVNAYYRPSTNEICFPAAILQPPFFDINADDAYNYGGIGAVIGHEVGHGFDDQGSQYDSLGNMENWWTDEDRANFTERADKLIAQYDVFEPREVPGQHVNGALTVGENIGDLGGLTVALQAYEISQGGNEGPEEDGLTARQRFFTGWATVWRSKRRAEYSQRLLSIDPHSPPEFRANIVRNLEEFHQAYATQPDDALWLDPEDRVRIW